MPTNKNIIRSYVDQDEYEQIIKLAKKAGVSVSTLIKRVCLGQQIRGTVDQEAHLTLIKSKADLGRLGGLLKKYLSESEGGPVSHQEVRDLLHSIEGTQLILADDFNKVCQSLLGGRK